MLPLENLAEEFAGSHNLLMEWVKGLPFLRDWTGDAAPVAYGAKIIQAGGPRQVTTWVDDGLAIGGAAAGLGIDFPFPNYTGPAWASGLALSQAVRAIRARGGDFTRAALEEHYAAPLRTTHYARDAEFLRRWPSYVTSTRYFFGPYLDVAAGAARIWARPGVSAPPQRDASPGRAPHLYWWICPPPQESEMPSWKPARWRALAMFLAWIATSREKKMLPPWPRRQWRASAGSMCWSMLPDIWLSNRSRTSAAMNGAD